MKKGNDRRNTGGQKKKKIHGQEEKVPIERETKKKRK
jgi:hypothetical protein